MKITPKQYAQSLFACVQDKKDKEIGRIIGEFAGILARNNDLGRADRIIAAFGKIWNKEKRIVEAEVTSAYTLSKTALADLSGHIGKKTGASRVDIKERLDKGLIGGVILKYGDKVWDASLKRRLSLLKEEMKK